MKEIKNKVKFADWFTEEEFEKLKEGIRSRAIDPGDGTGTVARIGALSFEFRVYEGEPYKSKPDECKPYYTLDCYALGAPNYTYETLLSGEVIHWGQGSNTFGLRGSTCRDDAACGNIGRTYENTLKKWKKAILDYIREYNLEEWANETEKTWEWADPLLHELYEYQRSQR